MMFSLNMMVVKRWSFYKSRLLFYYLPWLWLFGILGWAGLRLKTWTWLGLSINKYKYKFPLQFFWGIFNLKKQWRCSLKFNWYSTINFTNKGITFSGSKFVWFMQSSLVNIIASIIIIIKAIHHTPAVRAKTSGKYFQGPSWLLLRKNIDSEMRVQYFDAWVDRSQNIILRRCVRWCYLL